MTHQPSTRFARVAALILAAGAVATVHATPATPAAAATPPAAAAQKPVTIKVGYLAQLQDVALLALQDRLKDRHKVELVRYPRYADAEAALGRGDIQLASLGYDILAAAVARGGTPKFTYVAGLSRGAVSLVCRNEVLINAWPDVKGKRIGVAAGLPEVFIDDALAQHSLQATDIERVKFATGAPALAALREGAVQCASLSEPLGATAVAEGYAYFPRTDIADNSYAGINNGLAANPAFLKANREMVQDVVREMIEATAVFQRNRNAWIQELAGAQAVAGAASGVGVERVQLDPKLYMDEAWSLVVAMRPPAPALTTNPPSPAGAAALAAITKPQPERDAMNAYFDSAITEKP